MTDLMNYGNVADSDLTAQEAVGITNDPGASPQQQDLAYHRLMYLASLEDGSHAARAWGSLGELIASNATSIRETVFRAFVVRCPYEATTEKLAGDLFKQLMEEIGKYSISRYTRPIGYWMRMSVRSASVLGKNITEQATAWVDRFPDMAPELETFLVHYVTHGTIESQ